MRIEDSSNVFFTSDTHFSHKNILEYCARPFASAEEMDEALISNWNNVVNDDSLVFHLGDVAFAKKDRIKEVVNQLKGHIILIKGNHDHRDTIKLDRFDQVLRQETLQIEDRVVYLNHFPFLCYSGWEKGWIQLFGHVHTSKYKNNGLDYYRTANLLPTQYDVGVDNNDFTPVNWHKIKDYIDKQSMPMNVFDKDNMPVVHAVKKKVKASAYREVRYGDYDDYEYSEYWARRCGML